MIVSLPIQISRSIILRIDRSCQYSVHRHYGYHRTQPVPGVHPERSIRRSHHGHLPLARDETRRALREALRPRAASPPRSGEQVCHLLFRKASQRGVHCAEACFACLIAAMTVWEVSPDSVFYPELTGKFVCSLL